MKTQKNSEALNVSSAGNLKELINIMFNDYPYRSYMIEPGSLKLMNVNKAALVKSGFTKHNMAGKTLKDIYNEKKLSDIKHLIAESKKNGESDQLVNHGTFTGFSVANNGSSFFLIIDTETDEKSNELDKYLAESIISNADDAIYAKDMDGKILTWNKGAERIFGYSYDEIIGKSHFVLIPEERKNESEEIILNLKLGARIENFETARVRKDGREISTSITFSPLKNIDNELIGISVIARDITEKKLMEYQLKEKENRFKQIAENIKEVFYIRDAEVIHIFYISPAYEEIWGRSVDSLYLNPTSFYDSVVDEHKEIVNSAIEKQKNGEETEIEYAIVKSDNSRRWIRDRAFPVKDEFGHIYRIIGLAEDITHQKEIEIEKNILLRSLEDERMRLSNINSSVPGVVWEAWGEPDASSQRINFVNDYVEKMLGYTVEEWVSTPNFWLTIVHPDDKEIAAKNASKTFKSNEPGVNNFRWIAKDGRVVWIEAHSVVINDENGNPLGMRGVCIDVSERKIIEEIHQKLAAIVESSDDAIIGKNVNSIVTSWNKGAQRIFGYTADEMIGKPITLLFPTDNHDEEYHILNRIKNGESVEHFETIRKRKDGTLINISLTVSPIKNSEGKIVGASKIARDITYKKVIENELRESEEKYRHLTEMMPFGVYTIDKDGLITFYNETAAEIWGRHPKINDPEEQRYCGSYKLLSIDGIPVAHEDCPMAVALKEKKSFRDEEAIVIRPDGSRIVAAVNIDPVLDAEGNVISVINVFKDITERKKSERALKENEEQFRTLSENIAQFAWITDETGWINWYNKRWYDYTGTLPEEMQGWGWQKIQHPDHIERVTEKYKKHIASGEIWEDTFPIRGKDGNFKWFLSRARPLKNEDGKIIKWFGTNTDVTDWKDAQEALHKRTKTLEILNGLSNALTAELDLQKIVQKVTDAGREISGAEFGAFFYNVLDAKGESYTLYTLSGASRESFAAYPMPRNTDLFGPTFRGEGVVRIGDVLKDYRYGKNSPYHGMPKGHLPVRSYLAVPVINREGKVLGGLFYGHSEVDIFTADAEELLVAIASQAAIAVENSNLYSALERELEYHKFVEESLRESEKKYASLTQLMPVAVFSTDANGIITFYNDRAAELWGRKPKINDPDEVRFCGSWKLFEPDGKPMPHSECPMAVCLQENKPYRGAEVCIERPDGSRISALVNIDPLFNADGTFAGAINVFQDITERKLAEDALKESEARFRLMADTAPVLIWISGTDKKKIYFNQSWLDFTGRTLADEQGDKWTENIYKDDLNILENYHDCFEKKEICNLEYRLKRSDGIYRWILDKGVPRYDSNGIFTGYIGSCVDITDIKNIEEERRHMLAIEKNARQEAEAGQKQLEFLSEASRILSSSLDYYKTLSTVAELAVPAIADWCAVDILTEDETLDRVAVVHSEPEKVQLAYEVAKMYPPDPDAPTGALNVARTGKSEMYPLITDELLEMSAKDDYMLKLLKSLGLKSALIVPLFSGEKVFGVITLIYAESERRYSNSDLILAEELAGRGGLAIENSRLYYSSQKLNSELDKRVKIRTAQLEAANQELEAFSYSVSHDLRAPLRHITGYIGLLQEKYVNTLEEEAGYYFKKIAGSAKRMGNLIDDMLAFSRIARIDIQMVRINVQEMIKEVIQNFEEQTEGRKIIWKIGELPFVYGDRSMMRVVFVNLISNAIKFTRNKPEAFIEISCEANGNELVFSVKDNGAGFDMKYVNKLFSVFQRLHKVEDYEGDGIGLANIKRIIERHGGKAWAEGKIDQGASFYFSIPELTNIEGAVNLNEIN